MWRTTAVAAPIAAPAAISIHVLHVEDDPHRRPARRSPRISIHVLHVEDDLENLKNAYAAGKFQSTSSMWRTTQIQGWEAHQNVISIHVLHVEDDGATAAHLPPCANFNPRPPCGGRPSCASRPFSSSRFQSTSSMWRTTAKTEKNLYLHSYNTAICTNLQPKHSAYAFVCTDKDKQSHEKLVRSIRLRGDRSMFARPSSPDGALRKSARHPDGRRGERRRVPLCSGNGCPAGKSAGCPLPGRSIWSARP